jgi:hypothetical protein
MIKKMNLKKIFAIVFLLAFVSVPLISMAADSCTMSEGALNMMEKRGYECPVDSKNVCDFAVEDDCGFCCLFNTVYNVTNWAFLFIIIAASLMIILAASDYLRSQGDVEKVKSANQKIVMAAVAIVVGFFARALPGIVLSIIG